MKVINLTEDSTIYTSNVFLVLGTWNTISDVNTLIDVGSDFRILDKIENFNTGLGKNKIDQVIITHSHSDHTAMLPVIKEVFNPKVYAFNSHLKGIDVKLKDGDLIKIGDKEFEIFHITSHSYDSICLFNHEEGILFSGDTTFPINFENEALFKENYEVLQRLIKRKIKIIYKGHGLSTKINSEEFALVTGKFGIGFSTQKEINNI